MKKSTIYRAIFYIAGLLILALGIVLNTKSGLGVSPIISISYSVSVIYGLNFGNATFGLYAVFVAVEIMLHLIRRPEGSLLLTLGKDVLQLPLCLVFTRFMNLFSVLLPVFSLLVSLPAMLRAAYTPQLPLRCFCGQDAQFALQPSSASRLPVSCCRLHLLVCDAVGGTQQAEWLTLAGTLHFSLRVDTRHAGQQTFRVDRARVYDALGLVGLPLQLPTACSIAVEPEPLEPAELPNLSQFQYRSYHPKPGGGFSEIHDLREYRPGDSLHEIHWKLSAKTDKLIVREAEEPDLGLVVLSFDFSGTRAQLDSTLRQLLWLSGWLIDRGVPHQIDWIEPDSLEPQTKSVKTLDDLKSLLNTLLQTHLTGNTPSLASRDYPHADWRYHVQSETQEVQQA